MFAVLLQFPDSIKFISGLNTIVFSDCDCPFKGVGCSLIEEPKKTNKKLR